MPRVNAVRARTLIEAFVANSRFERVVDYLRRGRRFADKKFYTLKFDWRDPYTSFDDVLGSESEWIHLHDLEAELALRHDTVPRPYPARYTHGLSREQHAKRLRGDPAQLGAAERCIYESALLFEQSWRNAVKH